MTVEVVEDLEAIAIRAAAYVELSAGQVLAEKPRYVLALSGGSTPKPFHHALAARPEAIPWARLDVFLSDERAVAPEDPASNRRMVEETLLRPLGSARPVFVAPEGAAEDPVRAAARYEERLIEKTGGTGAADLVILGMGDDGHTASLFPGFGEPAGLVAAVEAPADNVVRRRISFTYDALARAKDVVVLVSGENKASRLAAVLEARADLPLARVLGRRAGRFLVTADEAAASNLGPTTGA